MSNKPDKKIRKSKASSSSRKRQRAPASPNVGELLQRLDFEELTVSEGGKRKRMPNIEVQFRTMFNSAMKGDLKVARDIVELMKEYKASVPRPSQEILFEVVPDEWYYGRGQR